jgi:hypothetical protein
MQLSRGKSVNGSPNATSTKEFEEQYETHFGETRKKRLLENIQKNLQNLNLLGLEEIEQMISRQLRKFHR